MSSVKVAITIDSGTLERVDGLVAKKVYPNRSRAIQSAVAERAGGSTPGVVLSHDVFNERSGTVIAVALTNQPQRAGFPLTLELQAAKLPKPSWVKISQIRTHAAERIGARLGRASPEEVAQVVEGLNEIIGI